MGVQPSASFYLFTEALPAPPLPADWAGSIAAAAKNKEGITGVQTGLGEQVPHLPWQPFCAPGSHFAALAARHQTTLTHRLTYQGKAPSWSSEREGEQPEWQEGFY